MGRMRMRLGREGIRARDVARGASLGFRAMITRTGGTRVTLQKSWTGLALKQIKLAYSRSFA
jgi:hypothetical protein